jgi:hypothetical protein
VCTSVMVCLSLWVSFSFPLAVSTLPFSTDARRERNIVFYQPSVQDFGEEMILAYYNRQAEGMGRGEVVLREDDDKKKEDANPLHHGFLTFILALTSSENTC